MEQFIPEIVTLIVVPLIGAAVAAVRRWLQARLAPAQIAFAHQAAQLAVQAVEEVARGIDMPSGGKLSMAEAALVDLARRAGVKLSANEAKALIHAVLNASRNDLELDVAQLASQVLEDILTQDEGGDESPVADASHPSLTVVKDDDR